MPDLAELFRRYGPGLKSASGAALSHAQRKAIHAIVNCRTPALGGHVYYCDNCRREHFACNSCNHRCCPRCGGADAKEWLEKQEARLLPVPYFLVTFTLPEELRRAAYANQRIVYTALMKEGASTLQELAQSRLGGEAGFFGVLHTWTRQLLYHPHVHFVVAGGVFCDDGSAGSRWQRLKKDDFLLPVLVLSRLFRRKLRQRLEAELPAQAWAEIPRRVWEKQWVVHSQAAGGGKEVLRYLSAYVFRSAITDKRIVGDRDGKVTFSWRPNGSTAEELCTLPAPAFLRRVLLHVLPKGLHKIRYFGWLHPRAKKRLLRIQTLLEVALLLVNAPRQPRISCPHCGAAKLARVRRIAPMRHDTS